MIIDNFIEYYFKKLLETKTNDKLPLYYSDRFRNILSRINDEISRKLLISENHDNVQLPKTYIDIDDDSNDKISFIMVNKIKDALNIGDRPITVNDISKDEYDLVFKVRQRSTMKINRFINEIFGDTYKSVNLSDSEKEYNRTQGIKTGAQKLEEFVNKFKSHRKPGDFQLVNGQDIIYWYNYQRYASISGSLGNSCMSHDKCDDYLQFYAKNNEKISLLILKDKEYDTKIIGRALIWKLDEPSGRTYMDRIYTNNDSDVEQFKDYAKKHKWLYKYSQNMSSGEYIVDTITGDKDYITLTVNDIKSNESYPYLDTLKYYDENDEIITNDSDTFYYNYKTLEDTNGGWSGYHNYTFEEMVEMYANDIKDDFKYYAQNYFPELVWNYVDDDRFVENYIDGEIDYYDEDFQNVISEDFIRKYIESNNSEEEIKEQLKKLFEEDELEEIDEELKTLDELDMDQLVEIVENLDIRRDIAEEYAREIYGNQSAREILEDIYGSRSVNNLDDDIYNIIENYIDEDDCATSYAESEDEDYLRERYDNN